MSAEDGSDVPDWLIQKPTDEVKEVIEAAFEKLAKKQVTTNTTTKEIKNLIELLCSKLKDMDDQFLDLDLMPRTF